MSSVIIVRLLLRLFGLMYTLFGLLTLPSVFVSIFSARLGGAGQIVWQSGTPLAMLVSGITMLAAAEPLSAWLVKSNDRVDFALPKAFEFTFTHILVKLFGLYLVVHALPEFFLQGFRAWGARDLSVPPIRAVQYSFVVVPVCKAVLGFLLLLKGDFLVPLIARSAVPPASKVISDGID